MQKIGFGGGCHWCTEAVFQFLSGVTQVKQGWISSTGDYSHFSEAVLLDYNPEEIGLKDLVSIHLHTHSSTANHPMRIKYRSAVYYFSPDQKNQLDRIMFNLQNEFDKKIVTKVIPFNQFKINKEKYLNYYIKNKHNTFCKRYIHPKLNTLLNQYSKNTSKNLKDEL